jgi:hypothetical protein
MKVRSSAHACCRRRAFSQLPIFEQIAERDGFHDGIGGAALRFDKRHNSSLAADSRCTL